MRGVGPIDQVCNRLQPLMGGGAPTVVVALDGHSAAGKSTMAEALAQRLDAATIHTDDFYRDLPEHIRLALSPAQGVQQYFDWERMRDQALVPLRDARRATFRCFDWSAGRGITDPTEVEPAPVVLVEGVYAARQELAHLLDLTVLISTGAEERARRRRLRHDPLAWESRWDAAEHVYFTSIRPPETFDLVVRGQA